MQSASVHVYVKNLSTEVLQDSFAAGGAVDIRDTRRPNLTWRLNLRHATPGSGGVAPSAGILTLEPQHQVDLAVSWPHLFVDEAGNRRYAWEGVNSTLHFDANNQPFFVTDPLYLVARANAAIFKTAGNAVTEEVIFRAVYWVYPDTLPTR